MPQEPHSPDWRDITTGPRDQTPVEVIDSNGAISRAAFFPGFGSPPGRWCYVDKKGYMLGKAYNLRGWRPLPPKTLSITPAVHTDPIGTRYNALVDALMPHMGEDLKVDPMLADSNAIDEAIFRRSEYLGGMSAVLLGLDARGIIPAHLPPVPQKG